MNSLSFLVQALILLTGPGFISQSLGEVTRIHNYIGGVQVWTENNCVYPDSTLYMAQGGQQDAPVPALQVCGVVEAKKVDNRTEQDVFLSQLCQTIYLLSQSICGSATFSSLAKDKLENSLNYTLMDVCDYAPILDGALKDPSTLTFFINGCEKMCLDNVKPLCRLLISAMCQVGHITNPSFTCTPKLLSSGAAKITAAPPPPGSSGNNSPAAALPVGNTTAAPAPPAPVGGSNSDAAAPTAAKPTPSVAAAAGSTKNQDQPSQRPVDGITGDNTGGIVPPDANTGASPGGDGNSAAAGVPPSASPTKDGSPQDMNSQTPKPVSSVSNSASPVKPVGGAVITPGSDPDAIPAGGSDPNSPNPGLHPEHDDDASPADSLFSSTAGDGTGTPGSDGNVLSPQGQAETPGEVAGPGDNPAGAAVPTAGAVKTNALPSSGNDPTLGEGNKNIVPTKTATPQQPAVPGSQDNAGVQPSANANDNNVISSNDGNDLSPLNKITKPTTQSINNGRTTMGFPQGDVVVDNDNDENYELPKESNQNQVPASQSESNNNHIPHPMETDEFQTIDGGEVPGSGHFFAYFLTAVVICISGYVIFHNKQKILAFIVEGRSGEGGRRRGNGSVQYSKLQSNVEEVMPSLDQATTAKNFVY